MVTKENRNVLILIGALFFVLTFLFLNPNTRNSITVYIVLSAVSFLIYRAKEYQDDLVGISTKTIFLSIIKGGLVGGLFYLFTRFIPAFSLGVPLLPNTISDQMKLFIVVGIAPPVEEIFTRGALMAYIRDFSPSKRNLVFAIIVQAIFFAFLHLGAYIIGFYDLPNLTDGAVAFSSNISAFISALIFGIIAGILVSTGKIKSLIVSIVLHMVLNAIVYTSLTVAFLG